MKIHWYSHDRRIAVEVEGDMKEVFKQLASVQEVFDAESACGCCNSANIRYNHRNNEGNDYFEMVCNDCRARFQFGQIKKDKDALFPKRRDNGKLLPNGGWDLYVKDKKVA